jgi:hypothetical protein
MVTATDATRSPQEFRAHRPADRRLDLPPRIRVAAGARDDLRFFRGFILAAIPLSLLMWAGIVAGLHYLLW